MSKDKSFHDYVLNDLFSSFDGITSRAMFGGYGFKKNGMMFGMIADGKLYFKVGDNNRKDYEKFGSKPFTYRGQKNKVYEMSYWEVPADCLENPEILEQYLEKAVDVGLSQRKNRLQNKS